MIASLSHRCCPSALLFEFPSALPLPPCRWAGLAARWGPRSDANAHRRSSPLSDWSGRSQAGNWLLVSHDAVTAETEDALVASVEAAGPTASSIYFKYEPLILHISCVSLEAGQR